jgi:hypothetical protein
MPHSSRLFRVANTELGPDRRTGFSNLRNHRYTIDNGSTIRPIAARHPPNDCGRTAECHTQKANASKAYPQARLSLERTKRQVS